MGFFDKITPPAGPEFQHYSNAYVFINGQLLAQEASVSIEKKSGGRPIFTLGAGLAGVSQGVELIELSIDNAVPSTDFEFNPDRWIRFGEPVEIGILMANRQSVFLGFILDATYSHAANDAAKMMMKLICRFAPFE